MCKDKNSTSLLEVAIFLVTLNHFFGRYINSSIDLSDSSHSISFFKVHPQCPLFNAFSSVNTCISPIFFKSKRPHVAITNYKTSFCLPMRDLLECHKTGGDGRCLLVIFLDDSSLINFSSDSTWNTVEENE